MEELTCSRCGGSLVEMNGTYYCWSCDAKYAVKNGELWLLECESCGGNLAERADFYECELCGAKYEKAVQKPEPVVSAPTPKAEKPATKKEISVPAPAPKEKKPVQKPKKQEEPVPKQKTAASEPAPKAEKPKEETDERTGWDWEFTQKYVVYAEDLFEDLFGEERFFSCCSIVYSAEEPKDIIGCAKFLEDETVKFFEAIEDLEPGDFEQGDLMDKSQFEFISMAMFEIAFARFFGAMRFLLKKIYEDIDYRPYKMKENTTEEMMKSLEAFLRTMEKHKFIEQARNKIEYICACFLTEIYKKTRFDVDCCKMFAERAAEIFTGSQEMKDFEEYCPNIAEVIKFCEGKMEIEQEEVTRAYWEHHFEDYRKMAAEKALLKKEREKLEAEKERALEEEKKKLRAVEKELKAVKNRRFENQNRSIKLNFFQKKEKKRLEEEMNELIVQEKNLNTKLKLREKEEEKNRDKIITKWAEKDEKLADRIFDIERELERNHYPGEELFVKIFEAEIKKAEEKAK